MSSSGGGGGGVCGGSGSGSGGGPEAGLCICGAGSGAGSSAGSASGSGSASGGVCASSTGGSASGGVSASSAGGSASGGVCASSGTGGGGSAGSAGGGGGSAGGASTAATSTSTGSSSASGGASSSSGSGSATCSVDAARGSGSGSGAGTNTVQPNHDVYPDLPKTASTVGASYTHFNLSSTAYQLTIEGAFTFVKGWIQWVIQPPPAAQAGLGGDIGMSYGPLQPSVVSGGGWRFAKEDTCSASGYSYWNGRSWAFVPQAWVTNPLQNNGGANLFGIGTWSEGGVNKAENSVNVPWPIPAWGPDDESYWAGIQPTWINTIQTEWSNDFDLHRKECPSTDPTCCRYHTQMVVSFTPVPSRLATSIILGANRTYVRSTSVAWCLGDSRKNLPAHEFGHLLGNADEYSGGSPLDTSWTDGPLGPGLCADSMMGQNMTIVKARHFRTICKQLSLMVDTAGGQSYGFTYEAIAGVSS
jgi:hypothetical protein